MCLFLKHTTSYVNYNYFVYTYQTSYYRQNIKERFIVFHERLLNLSFLLWVFIYFGIM